MTFWRNPEYVRHVRARLRPVVLTTTVTVVWVVCLLLAVWIQKLKENQVGFAEAYYVTIVPLQFVLLGLGSASACGQAIVQERVMQTYDFWRTTRLTPLELVGGAVLGAPVVAYLATGSSLPITLVTGLVAGMPLAAILATWMLLFVFAIFAGLTGLWVSMLSTKMNSGMAVALLVFLILSLGSGFANSGFAGLAALNPVYAIQELYGMSPSAGSPVMFGVEAPWWVLSLVLYAMLGAWLLLMLARNVKRDIDDIHLLSRWQAVGLTAFLNGLLYMCLDMRKIHDMASLVSVMVGINFAILYVTGLLLLTPSERLKAWWRGRMERRLSYLDEDGLPWPWIVLAGAAAYGFLVTALPALVGLEVFGQGHLVDAGFHLLTIVIFTVRDVLFFQWCRLAGFKQPLVVGVLYLMLYYFAVFVLVVEAGQNPTTTEFLVHLFTPFAMFAQTSMDGRAAPDAYFGLLVQGIVIVVLLQAVTVRLRRPPVLPAAAAAEG